MSAVLEVEGVWLRFGGNIVLRGVTMELRPGITGIVGVNGAGKTTLLDCASGFLRVDAGSIRLGGRPLEALPPARVRAAGLARTFQQGGLVPSESVGTNLLIGQHLQRRSSVVAELLSLPPARRDRARLRERGEALLARFGLADSWDVPVAELGAGLARCVEVAVALAGEPSVVLLDEPTSGLDNDQVQALLALLRDATRDGDLVMGLVEHNMAVVSAVCDTVHVVHEGVVLTSGPPGVVTRDPRVVEIYVGMSVPS